MTAIFPSSRPNISVRVIPKIPATMVGVGGIGISKENGVWTIEPSWDDLALIAPGILLDPTTKEVWVHDPVTDIYNRMTLGGLGQALFWGTSTTAVLIGAGSKTFETQSGKDWAVGSFVQAFSAADITDYVIGQVTAYSGTTLTVNVLAVGGSGTPSDWTIVPSTLPGAGVPGATGLAGGLNYSFVAGLSGDPGSGGIGLDSSAVLFIAQMRISDIDRNGVNLAAEIATWDDSTTLAYRAKVRIGSTDAPHKFIIATISGPLVDNGAYTTFQLINVTGTTMPEVGDCQVEVYRTGDTGSTGNFTMSISDTPPLGPIVGQTWFESDTGNTYVWYDDGTSAQWVQISTTNNTYQQTENFWADVDGGAPNILRGPDRAFFGQAVSMTGNRLADTGLPAWNGGDSNYPGWMARDADLVSMSLRGVTAVAGLSQTVDGEDVATNATIGVGGAVIMNSVSGNAWALYADVIHTEAGGFSTGLEIASKNMSSLDFGMRPYQPVTLDGTYGIWLAGGGDAAYGVPTHPSAAAMVVIKNATTFNSGIVFKNDALTRIGDPDTGTAVAVHMAYGHRVMWDASDGHAAAAITSLIGAGTAARQLAFTDSGFQFTDEANNTALSIAAVAGGVDYIGIANGTAGDPTIFAAGTSADVWLVLSAKGDGTIYTDNVMRAEAFQIPGGIALAKDTIYVSLKNPVGGVAINIGSASVGDAKTYYLANEHVFYNEGAVGPLGSITSNGFDTVNVFSVDGLQVVSNRNTGWAAMTGTTNKATVYDTASVTLPQLAGRVMALQAALTTHGLIGT